MAAVVKTPMPEKAIFTATAFEPKMTHKNTVNTTAANDSSGLDGCWSSILLQSMNYPAAPNGGIAASLGQATGYQSVNYNRPEERGTKPLSAEGGLKERHRIEGYPGGFCNS